MESNKSTRQEIEKTLQSIDGISRADMPPFFYTRLQARLDKRAVPSGRFWMIVSKPAVSLVTLSLLVVLNVAAISYYVKSSQKTTLQETTGIQKFAQEYDLDATSVYNDKTTGK
jgi:hypothetical protein